MTDSSAHAYAKHAWTPEEDNIIREMHKQNKSARSIAERINVNKTTVARRIVKLGLKKWGTNPARRWTPQMDDVIRRYINIETREQIGKRVGMSKGSVISRANRLGLTGKAPCTARVWTASEDDFLRENVSHMTQSDMGRELNRDPSSVSRRLDRLGIKPDRPAAPIYATPKAKRPPEVVPMTARPWLTKTNKECKYLFGQRYAYVACCQPVWMETGYCETHAALCGGYRKQEAA